MPSSNTILTSRGRHGPKVTLLKSLLKPIHRWRKELHKESNEIRRHLLRCIQRNMKWIHGVTLELEHVTATVRCDWLNFTALGNKPALRKMRWWMKHVYMYTYVGLWNNPYDKRWATPSASPIRPRWAKLSKFAFGDDSDGILFKRFRGN